MEQTANTTCKVCGKEYYACKKCGQLNHWKAVACSPEHYQQYVQMVLDARSIVNNVSNVIAIDDSSQESNIKTTNATELARTKKSSVKKTTSNE